MRMSSWLGHLCLHSNWDFAETIRKMKYFLTLLLSNLIFVPITDGWIISYLSVTVSSSDINTVSNSSRVSQTAYHTLHDTLFSNSNTVPEAQSFSSPQNFYRSYVRQQTPVVFRGVAKSLIAFDLWTNVSYLRSHHGNATFRVDERKRFYDQLPSKKRMTMSQFLDACETEELFLDAPITVTSLLKDVTVPPMLQCDRFLQSLVAAHLLYAHGNTSSYLHRDGYDNLLMVLAGEKRVLLINNTDSAAVYADDPRAPLKGLSPIDPDAVDVDRFPALLNASPVFTATLHAGDMVYVPMYWWHQVVSHGSPTIALALWSEMFPFDEEQYVNDTAAATARAFNAAVATHPTAIQCQAGPVSLHQLAKHSPVWTDEDDVVTMDVEPLPRFMNGTAIPLVTLGTARMHGTAATAILRTALELGYWAFDSAPLADRYAQQELGNVLTTMMSRGDLSRDDFFVTTKLQPQNHGYEQSMGAINAILAGDLHGLEFADMVLIHDVDCDDDESCPADRGSWHESWRGLEQLHRAGRVKHIGVSNFYPEEVEALVKSADIKPAVVQNRFDPFHQDKAMRRLCRQHGIVYQGYSLLGSAWTDDGASHNPVFASMAIREIAHTHGKSPAQVVLRFALQENVAVVVGSNDARHLAQDLMLDDFELSEDEMEHLRGLDGTFDNKQGQPTENARNSGDGGSQRLHINQADDLKLTNDAPTPMGSPWSSTLHASSDACLDHECEALWSKCKAHPACELCEESCVDHLENADYIACSTACVADRTPEPNHPAVQAMRALLACFAYCEDTFGD
eukprot:m.49316 g.49316  ORF g.49316 m.49316 type:complete len:794 (+) comp15319_c0_seq1:168-2549(+)